MHIEMYKEKKNISLYCFGNENLLDHIIQQREIHQHLFQLERKKRIDIKEK